MATTKYYPDTKHKCFWYFITWHVQSFVIDNWLVVIFDLVCVDSETTEGSLQQYRTIASHGVLGRDAWRRMFADWILME